MPDVVDLTAVAERYAPAPLVPPRLDPEDVGSLGYTGGSTGRPKGVMSTYRGGMSMTQIQMADWQWPDPLVHLICTPLSHAGGAFWIPVLLRGGSFVVLPTFTPASWLEAIETFQITSTMIVPAMLYAILDHPDLADPRHVEPAVAVLRRLARVAEPPRPGGAPLRPGAVPVLRAERGADDADGAAQGGPRPRQPRAPRLVRQAGRVGRCTMLTHEPYSQVSRHLLPHQQGC